MDEIQKWKSPVISSTPLELSQVLIEHGHINHRLDKQDALFGVSTLSPLFLYTTEPG